jgi:hypothetical protein
MHSDIILSTSTPSVFLEQTAAKYDIPIVGNPRRQGIAADWTFAYGVVSTQYVTLAHQDDLYSPLYAERCVRLADRHPDCLMAFTDYREWFDGRIRSSNPTVIVKRIILKCFYVGVDKLRNNFWKRALLSFGSPIPCPSVMFNKQAIGHFEFSDRFLVNIDWDAWLRLSAMEGSFLFVNDTLMTHRIHEASQTTVGLGEHARHEEDRMLFARLWPKRIANVLSYLYSFSYMSNV